MSTEQKRSHWYSAGSRIALVAGCMLLIAGCGLGSAKFGDPKIPPPAPPPPSGSA